jgi:SOS-response transcriptional repressor LexA
VGYQRYLGYQAFKHMQEKHKLVLDFIKAYIKIHGVAPSYSVIARGLGLKSKSNIHRIIHILKDEGLVAVKPYQFNSIRVIDRSVREVASL